MITVTTENWQQDANCAGVDPDLMQPEIASDEDVNVAKATCGRGTPFECPVLLQCKGLAESQPGGAYGVHAGEWYGHKPAPVVLCTWCGLMLSGQRSTRSYCNDTCRKRASRAAAVAATLSVA